MTDVFLEREWAAPLTMAELGTMLKQSEGCLDLHRVDWRGSLLSADSRRLLCHFSGPDTESVRIALRMTETDLSNLWPGTVHDAAGATDADLSRANVVVKRSFRQPVALDDIQAIEDAGIGCLETHRVRFVRTFFSADRRRMACLYQAPDAESVRIAQRQAQMPVDTVWAFRRFAPEDL